MVEEEEEGFVAADCLPFCLHSYRERRRRRRRNSAEKKGLENDSTKSTFSLQGELLFCLSFSLSFQ